MMEQVMMFATVLVPIVTAILELVKRTVAVKKNYIPLIAFLVGLVIGAAAYPFTDMEVTLRIWAGGFAGLSSTGLFEIMKRREGKTKEVK